jgi:hypothetical protein
VSNNVVQMHTSAADQLRWIADAVERGEYPGPIMVLTEQAMHMCMFPWSPERAATEAAYSLTRAMFQLHAVGAGLLEGKNGG